MAHMARLTKADEVVPSVGSFWAVKEPKRLSVVDRKAFPDMLSTAGASPALFLNNNGSGSKPPPAAIGSRSADPIRGRLTPRLGGSAASDRAKARDTVLLGQPRLLPKFDAAMGAGKLKAVAPFRMRAASDLLGLKGIGRAKPGPELVADQVNLGGSVQKRFCLPARPTGRATKSGPCRTVGPYGECGLTGFTGLFDHVEILAQRRTIGKRTTLIACRRVEAEARAPRFDLAPPAPTPTQESLL